ncbi:hypothetical protein D3C76_982840 [compost metagenome]
MRPTRSCHSAHAVGRDIAGSSGCGFNLQVLRPGGVALVLTPGRYRRAFPSYSGILCTRSGDDLAVAVADAPTYNSVFSCRCDCGLGGIHCAEPKPRSNSGIVVYTCGDANLVSGSAQPFFGDWYSGGGLRRLLATGFDVASARVLFKARDISGWLANDCRASMARPWAWVALCCGCKRYAVRSRA